MRVISSKEQQPMTTLTTDQTTPQAMRPDRNAISAYEPIVEIVFTTIALVVFNVLPQRVGVLISAMEPDSFVPLLSPIFFERYLPWLNVYWALTLGLAFINLVFQRWTIATRLADIGVNFLGLNIFVSMLFGSSILGVNPEWAEAGSAWVQVAQALVTPMSWVVSLVLVIAIFATVVELIKRTVELVRAVVG
jgi:hypothetical protein